MSEISPKIFVCHVPHEHDRVYAENVVEYLSAQNIASEVIELRDAGLRPELQRCLDEPGATVLGFNAALDHSSLESGPFLEAAERRGLPVIQWILDHPGARWPEFGASTASNSRFLLNSRQQQRYFETYCLPGALTAVTGGVGPNWRTRFGDPNPQEFVSRPLICLIPLSLRRIRSVNEHDAARAELNPVLAGIVDDAAASARHDLAGPLHPHVAAALARSAEPASPATFNLLCRLVEEAVQTFRRLHVFSVARHFPVLIQSDASAARFVEGGAASFASDVGMEATLERMPTCRAVLSVTPMNDMIHDRTMNAVNAGCVAIAEDNAANREIFTHGENALLFHYDDDSLAECLDIVCNQPERACEIARAGMKLRDDPRIRFGQFPNIVDLARGGQSCSFAEPGNGENRQSRQSRPRARPVVAAPRERQAILILGMHRSGTSALAGVVNGLGAAAPKNLAGPNDANPRGYFESAGLFVVLDAMLAAAGSCWDDWRQLDCRWFETETGQRYRKQIKALLLEEFGDQKLIVVKDPRICRFAPFMSSILAELGFAVAALLPVRNFGEVASSLERRDRFAPAKSILLWLRHVFDAERDSRQMPRYFLSYEGLLADWRTQIACATATIGIDWPGSTEAAESKIDEFLDSKLRRERASSDDIEELQGLTRMARRVQAVLDAVATEGESVELLGRLQLLRREFDEACDLFGAAVADRPPAEAGLPVPAAMPGGKRPKLSVIVVVYNMPREAPRTLYSLSAAYQRDIAADDYEVIVVDNGSEPPFDAGILRALAGNFRLVRMESPHPSPVRAANRGLVEARGRIVGMLIDGARMATPGLLHFALHGARLYEDAAVTALGWHLGFDLQNWAIQAGYDKNREDALLDSIGWPKDGYRLFEIATPGGSSTDGWFLPVAESNALFLRREVWDTLGGLDERFDAPGGGYVNLDLWRRAVELPGIRPVILLGEGTFHQLHGGVATNAAPQSLAGALEQWEAQYKAIRGHPLSAPTSPAASTYVGILPRPALARFVRAALDPARARLGSGEPPLGSAFDRTLWALAPTAAPRDPVIAALIELTHQEFRAGRIEAAAAVARLARRCAPDEPAPQRILALAGGWLPHGDPPEDRRAEVHLALGEAYRLLGESEAAEQQYRAALRSDDDCVEARLGLSKLRMPGPDYLEWLRRLHAALVPETYLEIGIARGASLRLARPPTRAIAIDPRPLPIDALDAETHILRETSDEFFAGSKLSRLLQGRPLTMAFLDGAHTFRQSLKDFANIEAYCGPRSVVLLHDTIPLDEPTQRAERQTEFYTGDVWKTVLCLKHSRQDLDIFTIPAPWSGLTVITGLDADNRVSRETYDDAIRRFDDMPYSALIERRDDALNVVPNDWNTVEARLNTRGIRLAGPHDSDSWRRQLAAGE